MFQSGPGGQTNDLGEFRLFDLSPGEYIVLASPRQEFGRPGTSAPQSATIVAPTYFPGALDPLAAQPVTVTAGQTAGDVVIRMAVVPAFQIAGLVVDESDKPVDGAVVTMMPEVSPGGFTPRPPMPGPGFVRSDAAGRFVITNVTNGSYRVAASIPVAVRTVTTRTGSGDGMVKTQILGTAISGSTAVVSNGVVTGGTYTDPQSGRMFQYTTAGAQAVAVTVADANVSDVRLVAVSPQQ
jgi:hypothetical protein